MRILSTKILAVNQKDFLLNAGFSVIEADFIRVTRLPFQLLDVNDNLILTSQNAVRALADHPNVQDVRRNPVFCVGTKTADLLDELGFTVQETAQNAQELAQVILQSYAAEKFTFFSGSIRRNELPLALMEQDIELNEIEVYETELTPMTVSSATDAILFFSPSAVQSYLKANTISEQMCFCIGQTTAAELEKITQHIIVANQPSVENTIIQAINHYKST